MSAMAQRHRTIPVLAIVIAYGAPAIAILAYLTVWPVCLQTMLHLKLPIGLSSPLWTDTFNDLNSVLRAIACARQGVDVTLPNACMGGGLFQYSPLLLTASPLPIGPALRVPLGLGLDALFLLSLAVLPHPRRWREFCCLLLAALSSSTFWALESANIDIALYLLVLLAAHLLLRGAGARLAGYATLLLAGAIKFYPACLLILATRERPARFVQIALAALAAAVLLAVAYAAQLDHILPRLPRGSPFAGAFGATNLPSATAMLLAGDNADGAPGQTIRCAAMLGLIAIVALIVRRCAPALLPALRTMPARPRTLLVAGAASMTFCFLATQNIQYRQIFLILTLPGFWDLDRRGLFRPASWGVIGLMWSYLLQFLSVDRPGAEPFLPAFIIVWAVREALWWWLISLFAAIILCFLWDSPGLAPVLARWRAPPQKRSAG
jgi:hypothetical protein